MGAATKIFYFLVGGRALRPSRSEKSVAEGASAKSAVGLKSYIVVLGVRANHFYKKFQVKLKILISLLQVINGIT